jgi:tetratricopeptide (TPR) repeat protein
VKQKAQTIDQKLKKLMRRAVTLHRDGKLDEAEPLYQNYLAIRPHNAHVWTNLGALLRSRDLYEPSIAMHRKALQINPGLEAADQPGQRSERPRLFRGGGGVAPGIARGRSRRPCPAARSVRRTSGFGPP